MKLFSDSFQDGEKIPIRHTCKGEEISPSLKIADVPSDAKSLVLIMDDPDVPSFVRKDNMWVHWVIYNMPPTTKEIAEGKEPTGIIGKGTEGKMKYQGPCPPDREHRYFFKLYALDQMLSSAPGKTKEEVGKEMQGHILAEAVLMGRF